MNKQTNKRTHRFLYKEENAIRQERFYFELLGFYNIKGEKSTPNLLLRYMPKTGSYFPISSPGKRKKYTDWSLDKP